jgi:hypothetical protein
MFVHCFGFGCNAGGRVIQQGVVGFFAASSFKPDDNVKLKDGNKLTLAQYAARRNLKIITGAEFNKKLRERGIESYVTVQKNVGQARTRLRSGRHLMRSGKPRCTQNR